MRYTVLLSIMLMVTSGVVWGERVWPPPAAKIEAKVLDMKGLVKRDGLVYKKGTTELFTGHLEGVPPHEWTGEVEGTYEKAHRYLKGSYQDGLKHGFWEWYYYDSESGTRYNAASRTTYLYGKKHGLAEFYNHGYVLPVQSGDNYAFGAVLSRNMYKDGLWDGPWEEFERDGSVHSSGMAKDGQVICTNEVSDNNGEVKENKCYNEFRDN